MPPLHRMPVVYLAAAVLAGALAVASSVGKGRPVGTARPAAPPSDSAPSPAAPATEAASEAPDPILRTAEGLRRKIVVRTLGLIPRTDPGGRAAGTVPLDYFSIRYLYGEAPPGSPEWLQVGPREGPPQGWVPAEAVLEWSTRLVARPTPRGDRPPLVLFRERSCLIAALDDVACANHRNGCPTEGEEDASADETAAAGLPILRSESVPVASGEPRTIFEVASLVRDRAQPAPPARLPADMLAALRRVDVAFVLDTTASMQASLDAARQVAAGLVDETSRRYGDIALRLALVEYRDAAPAYGFRARVTTPFTDPAGFRRALDGVSVAKAGDGSVDEQVLDGIEVASPSLDEGTGQVAGHHLNWPTGRTGELTTKLLVLVGDAPDHARDPARAERLAAWAKERGITIAAVRIPRPDRSRDEEARYVEQWQVLAEGSFRPPDRAAGFDAPIAPLLVELDRADQLAGRLRALLDDRVEAARTLAALAAAEAENRLTAYVTSQGLTLDQVHPVLVDLHKDEEQPQARPDPRAGGRKAPSVRRGWIAERRDGRDMVTVEVLMSRAELDALIGELLAVQQAAQGTARTLDDLLQIGTAAAAGETAFLTADRGTTTFADHLRRRQGLPPARADSVLRATQADLLQADDLTRAALDERLGTAIDRLIGRRNESDWDDPRRTIDGMAPVPYAWIDF